MSCDGLAELDQGRDISARNFLTYIISILAPERAIAYYQSLAILHRQVLGYGPSAHAGSGQGAPIIGAGVDDSLNSSA